MNIADKQKRKYLSSCPLFSDLKKDVVKRIAARAHGVFLLRGKVLFHQGDPSDGLYVLCSGLVRVSIVNSDGDVLTLAVPEHGTPLGEMTLVSPDPRSATVTALEDSSLLHLDTATMVALLSDEPALAAHVIRYLSQRLRESNATLQNFAFENLSQRLLQMLAELGLKHGSLNDEVLDLGRKYSQSALAEMLGVTREAINKQLKLLQDEGKISMRQGIIQIVSPADIIKNTHGR
ncbi:cAMP receptor protein [Roseovarius sp. THAF9]|uniref:Crp/Fnr family transcriptional regulator n=1 Tax=Roseovarius sp. THAF9 TaxID=2587847 RepID=UPI001268CF65|nr:Crp/Fnr family transcriptional regulator [Roseovarius sp. THAF9]QFT93854.1 cAMP receptor protein [Roseovarius sp. THAF9]